MPELPEIACRAREMNEHLANRKLLSIEVKQPKCLNVPVERFLEALVGATIGSTSYHGKWLLTVTSQGYLLINLGMGGELLLTRPDSLPDKWRVRFDFADGEIFAVNFWWFGSTHYAETGALTDHPMISKLGPNALGLSRGEFVERLSGRRGGVKSFLLNQSNIAGIGNAYIHDILFRAKLHPLRVIPTLSRGDIDGLFQSMRSELERSIAKGAANYELDLLGRRGGFGADDLLVGYREGEACPMCNSTIEKIKTGSTSSYICPHCQPI